MTPLAPQTLANLRAASTAALTTQLFRRGFANVYLQGVHPLGARTGVMAGPAYTLRYIPAREDLDGPAAAADPNAVQREAFETIPAGAVLVMDCRGETRAGAGGEILVTRLLRRGAAGLVTDGCVRDARAVAALDLPVFCAGPSAPINRIVHHALELQRPIGCGGVAVYPDDVVVGDGDGVVVIPRALADEVAHAAAEAEALDAYVLARIAAGEPLAGLMPPSAATRARFDAERAHPPT